jgi:hypothetical protein
MGGLVLVLGFGRAWDLKTVGNALRSVSPVEIGQFGSDSAGRGKLERKSESRGSRGPIFTGRKEHGGQPNPLSEIRRKVNRGTLGSPIRVARTDPRMAKECRLGKPVRSAKLGDRFALTQLVAWLQSRLVVNLVILSPALRILRFSSGLPEPPPRICSGSPGLC